MKKMYAVVVLSFAFFLSHGQDSGSAGQVSDSAAWYQKAFMEEKDTVKQLAYAVKLAALYQKEKDYSHLGYWQGKAYHLNPNATNVDLFNWGVALFNAKEYQGADSVFAIYQSKYPDQAFGYYWRARSNAAIDTAMETGIAIPHYENLVKVASKDTANATNKRWLIQAYGYLAAFKANKYKQYAEAIAYYNKLLELDPSNAAALKYKEMLEKKVQAAQSQPAQPGSNK
jgi:tetratricopeptide (TPR) repeat protein